MLAAYALPVMVLALQATELAALSIRPFPFPDYTCPLARCIAPNPELSLTIKPRCPRQQCERDADCYRLGKSKCCDICGCKSCHGRRVPTPLPWPPTPIFPIDPVDPEPLTCRTMKCKPGYECVPGRQIYCFRAPCPQPRPRCVRAAVKPGSCPRCLNAAPFLEAVDCPRLQCRDDRQCGGERKCCTGCDGCRTCADPQLPLIQPLTCASVTCVKGQVCVEKPVPHCEDQVIKPDPVRPVEKPGKCPAPSGLFSTCVITARSCWSDDMCPGVQKCCREGCGSECKNPL